MYVYVCIYIYIHTYIIPMHTYQVARAMPSQPSLSQLYTNTIRPILYYNSNSNRNRNSNIIGIGIVIVIGIGIGIVIDINIGNN